MKIRPLHWPSGYRCSLRTWILRRHCSYPQTSSRSGSKNSYARVRAVHRVHHRDRIQQCMWEYPNRLAKTCIQHTPFRYRYSSRKCSCLMVLWVLQARLFRKLTGLSSRWNRECCNKACCRAWKDLCIYRASRNFRLRTMSCYRVLKRKYVQACRCSDRELCQVQRAVCHECLSLHKWHTAYR